MINGRKQTMGWEEVKQIGSITSIRSRTEQSFPLSSLAHSQTQSRQHTHKHKSDHKHADMPTHTHTHTVLCREHVQQAFRRQASPFI